MGQYAPCTIPYYPNRHGNKSKGRREPERTRERGEGRRGRSAKKLAVATKGRLSEATKTSEALPSSKREEWREIEGKKGRGRGMDGGEGGGKATGGEPRPLDGGIDLRASVGLK